MTLKRGKRRSSPAAPSKVEPTVSPGVSRAPEKASRRTFLVHPMFLAGTVAGTDLGLTLWYHARQPAAILVNHGVAFGLFPHYEVIVWLSQLTGMALVVYAYRRWTRYRYGMAAILGGAAANIISRLAYGGVIDYWRLTPYPYTFNLADVAIRAGLVFLALQWWVRTGRARE